MSEEFNPEVLPKRTCGEYSGEEFRNMRPITEEDERNIFNTHASGANYQQISKIYNVPIGAISGILDNFLKKHPCYSKRQEKGLQEAKRFPVKFEDGTVGWTDEEGFNKLHSQGKALDILDKVSKDVESDDDLLEEPLCNNAGLTEEQLIRGTLFANFLTHEIITNSLTADNAIRLAIIYAKTKTNKIYNEYEKQKLD